MFSPRETDKSDYISVNIHDGASFARGTSRSLWRVRIFKYRVYRNRIAIERLPLVDLFETPSVPSSLCISLFQQWNQLSRFQRNILYFAVITILLVIFYLLPNETKGTSDSEVDYNNVEVVQETAKYEKVYIWRVILKQTKRGFEFAFENI